MSRKAVRLTNEWVFTNESSLLTTEGSAVRGEDECLPAGLHWEVFNPWKGNGSFYFKIPKSVVDKPTFQSSESTNEEKRNDVGPLLESSLSIKILRMDTPLPLCINSKILNKKC